MVNYNKLTLAQLFLVLKERNIRGKSSLPKAGIVKCLEDHDRLMSNNATRGDGMKMETTTDSTQLQRSQYQEDSEYIGTVPSSKLQACQVRIYSSRTQEVLAVLRQDKGPHIRARSDLEDDDITRIAELFHNIVRYLSELPMMVSPSTFFQKLKSHMSIIYTEKVTLNYKESVPLFDIFDIQSDALGTSIAPQEVTDIFCLRRALLEFLDEQAKEVPAEEKKFPLNFPKVEVIRLREWYLGVEKEHNIDNMSIIPGTIEAKELYSKLESLFTATELVHLSQSSKTTESIVVGLHKWRRHTINANQAVMRKRAASTMEEGKQPKKEDEDEEDY
jgi:hypothetical protein